MHTVSNKKYRIHFNPDLSGKIIIFDIEQKKEIEIDGEIIKELIKLVIP